MDGHTSTVEVLLQHGADPNRATTDMGMTPIFSAIVAGFTATMQVLLQNGADPNRATTDGTYCTPLKIATTSGKTEVVALLLAAGAKE